MSQQPHKPASEARQSFRALIALLLALVALPLVVLWVLQRIWGESLELPGWEDLWTLRFWFGASADEFAKGAVRFANIPRLELALLLVAVAILAAWYLYYRMSPATLRRRTRAVLWVLRGLALALVMLILCRLVLSCPLPQTSHVFAAVVVDDSRSMRIEDAGPEGALTEQSQRKSRLAAAKELLGNPEGKDPTQQAGLLGELAEGCPVRLFKFSVKAERIRDMQDVNGGGDRTNLYAALSGVDSHLRGVPLAGVVLVTDGAANAGGDSVEMARHLGLRKSPVYCVGLGDPQPPRDYEIVSVQCPREVRANTDVDIFASVRALGLNEPFEVHLYRREGNKLLKAVKVAPDPEADMYRVRLPFRPDEKGTFRYAVQIPPHSQEVILDNNRYEFLVRVADRRLPVLYLEGSPREEYRFLRRALFRDKDFRIVSVLRLVNERPDKLRDRKGPRPFITQGAEPEDGLKDGYPKTEQHLYRFEAVIFGDIEAGYLTPKQLEITEKFVRERGGGFLMLGGVNSFNQGKYHRTAIDKMLPVVLPPPDVAYHQVEFSFEPTEVGYEHSILMQSGNPLFNRNIWSKAPTLIGYNPIRTAKPAALTLGRDPKTGHPVLVVQRYGAGRSAAFTTGGSWHWQMARPREDELHEKFWKQLVRWIAVGAKAKISIELDKDIFARKEPVSIRTTVLDKTLKPDSDAKVVAKVTDPFGNALELPQRCVLSEEGVYDAQYEPLDVGDYRLEVEAVLSDGTEVSTAAVFSVGETLDEFSDAGQKVALLEEIASASAGKYYKPGEAMAIAREIKKRVREFQTEKTTYRHQDLWDTPLLFALLALALSVEWFIRRRAGLM